MLACNARAAEVMWSDEGAVPGEAWRVSMGLQMQVRISISR